MFLSMLSVGREKPSSGEPATIRSTPARASLAASAVDSTRASGPMPSAMARATAAVLPQCDSYTTMAFMPIVLP